MNRRNFLKTSLLAFPALTSVADQSYHGDIIGHGDFKYRVDKKWAKADPSFYPVKNCHEMVQVPDGRLFLITDVPKNNILIFDTDGNIKGTWTANMKGAHGLTLSLECEEPHLFLTDTKGRVIKTDLDGKVLLEISDSKLQAPTETAIGPDGAIYVIDGYGSQFIYQYDQKGKFIRKFGGKSTQASNKHKFMQAHGIAIDDRGKEPLLICTARLRNEFKWFTLDGKFVKSIYLPGVYMSRPVIDGDYLYSGVCFGGFENDYRGWPNRGYVVILDKENKVISAPGGHQPRYNLNGKMEHLYQDKPVFTNVHDICVDKQGDLYACQWNAGRVYPYKLHKV